MHHLIHSHIVTHVIAPLVVSLAIGAIIASQDSRGTHPSPALSKVHAPTRGGK